MKQVTLKVDFVNIPYNNEGAARILAQIAKPTNPGAGMKKLRDLGCLIEGETPFNNRSHEQVKDAASSVWLQVRRAIDIGDWFDRMFAASPSGNVDDPSMRKYAQTLAKSLNGADKQVAWRPYQSVAHMAAGFRIALLKTGRGRFFSANMTPRAIQIDQLSELIFADHGWLKIAIEQAQARLMIHSLHGRQAPARSRMFVLAGKSQKSPPMSQDIPPAG